MRTLDPDLPRLRQILRSRKASIWVMQTAPLNSWDIDRGEPAPRRSWSLVREVRLLMVTAGSSSNSRTAQVPGARSRGTSRRPSGNAKPTAHRPPG